MPIKNSKANIQTLTFRWTKTDLDLQIFGFSKISAGYFFMFLGGKEIFLKHFANI